MNRIYVAVALVALLALGYWVHGNARFSAGEASVQAKWDAANAKQTHKAVTASEAARSTEQAQVNTFAAISTNYLQATTHAYPSIADALPAAVGAGTLRLRDDCPATAAGGGRAEATAGSRAADAASTQALADRVQAAIAAVRAGDEADARERQLGAQIQGLQAVLTAERVTQPGTSQ